MSAFPLAPETPKIGVMAILLAAAASILLAALLSRLCLAGLIRAIEGTGGPAVRTRLKGGA